MTDSWYRIDDARQCLVLTLHVQPNARVTSAAGLHGDALKIKIAAAAVDGRANAKLLAFLAGAFDVPLRQVTLKQGAHGRRKVVEVYRPARKPEALLID